MKKYIVYLFLLFPIVLKAQNIKGFVYGIEKNGKLSLPGVNIYWQHSKNGTASTSDGSFEIQKKTNQHNLVFSFVGYKQKVVQINDLSTLEVVLEPNFEIEEVTIIKKDRGTYLSVINPIQTERIGGAELHKAACCNLAESFETNPSVDVSYSDAVTGAKQIRLLGLEGTYSLLQVENMPNLRGLATTFGLTYIPGPWLQSIQVSKGAASIINGSESIAGQINAELKKPDGEEKLFLNLYRSVEGMTEFNGNTNIRLRGGKVSTGLLMHVSDLSKINDHNNDGFLDHPLSERINVLNRWKYNNGKGHMAQWGIGLLAEDRTGGQTYEAARKLGQIKPWSMDMKTERFEGFFKTGYVFPNGRTAIAWLSNVAHHKTNSFYGNHKYLATESRFYGNAVLTRDLDEAGVHTLNSGFSFVYDKIEEKLYGNEFSRTEKVPGIFTEYTLMPNEKFTLMAGLRADFHNTFGTFVTPRMHIRYQINKHVTLRTNAGKGYRTANVIAENTFMLANARDLDWETDALQEEAWNYGVTVVQTYRLLDRELQINAEFYRTNFQNQLVVDRETSGQYVKLIALNGKSYANSLQFDLRWQPIERLDMLVAYRINDIKQTIGGKLLEKPLTSRYKGLVNFNYTTKLKKWMFDYTVQFNGGGRVPIYTAQNNEVRTYEDQFLPFTIMNAQITKYFRYWNVYLGSENFTNFKQKHPVQGADDPFGSSFDATNVWGPVLGRKIYIGLRFNLNYES